MKVKDRYVFLGDMLRKKYVMVATKHDGKYMIPDIDKVTEFIQDTLKSEGCNPKMILFTETSSDYKSITQYWQGDK